MSRVQRYTFPDHPLPIPLSTALIALPGEIQTQIFLYLSIDDLSVLSQCVDELKGLEMDGYLRKVWYSSTVPARLDFALFSSYNARPDVHELVRRGTIKGVAIVAGVRNGSYWCSESAVRLSNLHHALQQAQLRRQLSSSLSSSRRPTLHALHSRHIIPSSSSPLTSAMIVARVYALDKARERDTIKRALTAAKIGQRTLIDVLTETTGRENRWAASEGERVRWAVCPGIRGKMRFFEQLASGAAVSLAGESGVGKRVAAA